MRANDSNTIGPGTVLLTIVAVALAGMIGTIGLIHQVGELGPKVGDIITFDPLDQISRDMRARVPALAADNQPGVACALDVRAMHTNGGSVVIEARQPGNAFGYLAHWSGGSSSNDSTTCGTSADLLLNIEDVELLAMAAGGFGTTAAKHRGSFWPAANAAQ